MSSRLALIFAIAGAAILVDGAGARAQGQTGPTAASPWFEAAPFPEPSEELLGATANGRLYALAGLAPGLPGCSGWAALTAISNGPLVPTPNPLAIAS